MKEVSNKDTSCWQHMDDLKVGCQLYSFLREYKKTEFVADDIIGNRKSIQAITSSAV